MKIDDSQMLKYDFCLNLRWQRYTYNHCSFSIILLLNVTQRIEDAGTTKQGLLFRGNRMIEVNRASAGDTYVYLRGFERFRACIMSQDYGERRMEEVGLHCITLSTKIPSGVR